MADTAVAPPESAAPPATTTTTTEAPTQASPSSSKWDSFKISDDQLKSAGFTESDIKEAAAESAGTPIAAAPSKTTVEEKDADAVNLDFLKEEPAARTPAPAPVAPELQNPDAAMILKFFPNADVAAMGAQGLQITNSYSRGNVDEFLSSLQNINPQAFQHLQEQLYQRLMPSWVDRYIEENDPNANPGQQALKRRVEIVERERAQERQNLAAWQQEQMRLQQQQQHQGRLQQIDNQLNQWLDQAKFTDRNGWTAKDRDYVLNSVRVALAGNKPLMDQTFAGNLNVLRNLVRDKTQDYIDLDRARAQALKDRQTKQETSKKPPLQAAGVGTTASNQQKDKNSYYEAAAAWARDHQTT